MEFAQKDTSRFDDIKNDLVSSDFFYHSLFYSYLFSTLYQCFFPTCLIVKQLHCFCNSLMLDI